MRSRPSLTRRAPRRTVTGRAIVLGAVVVLLLVLLASPLRRYFASRGAVSTAAQQYQDDQTALAEVKKQLALWSDPGFIQQQARERLEYAMPGDTVYIVVGKNARNDIVTGDDGYTKPPPAGWNAKLWSSVQRADSAKK